jgi:hypothetical protein
MQGNMVCMNTNWIVQDSANVTRELGNSNHGFQHICDQTQILEIEKKL